MLLGCGLVLVHDAKVRTLHEIDTQVNSAFQATLDQMKVQGVKVDLSKFESLLQLRAKVDAISTWPFKLKVITAGASVIFFSSVPVVLQFLLERFF